MFIDFGKNVTFLFTLLQIIAGPFLFLSLKGEVQQGFLGGSVLQTSLFFSAILLAISLIFSLYQFKKKESAFWLRGAVVLFILVIGAMGWLRHEVRDTYLMPYQAEEIQKSANGE